MKNLLVVAIMFLSMDIFSQNKTYEIRIFQNDRLIAPEKDSVKLEKKPFVIEVRLNQLDGVYLYAAFADSVYNLSKDQVIRDFKDLPAMAMAETEFNTDQELIIQNESWSFWFYDEKLDWHRFDKNIKIDGKIVTGRKTIKQFYFPEETKSLPVENVTEPLYCFFTAIEQDKKGNAKKELQRYKLKITWQ